MRAPATASDEAHALALLERGVRVHPGYFYDFLLALSAHLMAGDGEFAGALVALILVSTSYATGRKLPTG